MSSKSLVISSYNDPLGLDRGLSDDTVSFFDEVIVIEGAYEGYDVEPGYNPYDIVERYPDITVKVMDGYKQIEKRNEYFRLSGKYDFCLVMDSDEYLRIDHKTFNDSLDSLLNEPARCFPIEFDNLRVAMCAPRLFRKPFGLHHKQSTNGEISHGSIYDENDAEIIRDIWHFRGIRDHQYVKGVKLFQDKETRSLERLVRDLKYQQTVRDR